MSTFMSLAEWRRKRDQDPQKDLERVTDLLEQFEWDFQMKLKRELMRKRVAASVFFGVLLVFPLSFTSTWLMAYFGVVALASAVVWFVYRTAIVWEDIPWKKSGLSEPKHPHAKLCNEPDCDDCKEWRARSE